MAVDFLVNKGLVYHQLPVVGVVTQVVVKMEVLAVIILNTALRLHHQRGVVVGKVDITMVSLVGLVEVPYI
jgi:hypothetical protein